jgi:hypothetical protein
MSIQTGERLPPVALRQLTGETVAPTCFYGRLSLALFLAGDGSDANRLAALTAIEPELRSWGAETILVVAGDLAIARRLSETLPFAGTTLLDAGGELHRRLDAFDPDSRPCPALRIADRVGELRFGLDLPDSDSAPLPENLAEAIDWARYLGIQEPECGCCSVAEGWGEQE